MKMLPQPSEGGVWAELGIDLKFNVYPVVICIFIFELVVILFDMIKKSPFCVSMCHVPWQCFVQWMRHGLFSSQLECGLTNCIGFVAVSL